MLQLLLMSPIKALATALTPVADYFKVLFKVSLLQLFCCVKAGSKNVTEIIELTRLRQANVSKHLKILTQIGLVICQALGTSIYYETTDSIVFV